MLVDFENVQPKNVGVLSGRSFRIKVFVGANQGKIPFEMARALQAFGPDAEYIQIDGSGKNALDFHIAYYMGRLAAETPGASIYVISKDTGFDPLIKHLKTRGILCQRLKSIADIPGVKASAPKSVSHPANTGKASDAKLIPQKVDLVIANLLKRKAATPGTLKALRSTIKALFNKDGISDAELEALVGQLTARGTIKVADGKVSYELPS